MAGARHYSELIVWQLGDAIRRQLYPLTRRTPFSNDCRLRRQVDDAAGSICRNIAEGFGCDSHAEFARYLEISRRSLNELLDCLLDALLKKHVTPEEITPIRTLARRLFPAIASLRRHLRDTPSPNETRRASRRPTAHSRTRPPRTNS